MNIIVAGGTGLIGQLLIPNLLNAGHQIAVVGRDKEKISALFSQQVQTVRWDELNTVNPDEFGIIINLVGENIADHRWSTTIKKKLLNSRINATQQLINWAKQATMNKPHLYNASAVGIYGLQQNTAITPLTEQTDTLPNKSLSFSSELVHQWEQSALAAAEENMPVTLMRFGVVLKAGEGMLNKLELPSEFGLGAVVGTGDQPLAWIHHHDLTHAILFLIAHPEIIGPVNLVAPEIVSQKKFMRTLAQQLKKPLFLRLPAWFVSLLLGQMGKELLLSGQVVAPKRLLDLGFKFSYPKLEMALEEEFIPLPS